MTVFEKVIEAVAGRTFSLYIVTRESSAE